MPRDCRKIRVSTQRPRIGPRNYEGGKGAAFDDEPILYIGLTVSTAVLRRVEGEQALRPCDCWGTARGKNAFLAH